jgi:hypothetical protein
MVIASHAAYLLRATWDKGVNYPLEKLRECKEYFLIAAFAR